MVCPICFNTYTNLLPHGVDADIFQKYEIVGGGLRYSKCPTCESTDRERLTYIYLIDFFKILDQQFRVLHFAPERGIYYRLFDQIEHYIVGDLNPKLYPNIATINKIDLLDTGFEDSSFDLVICNHVLEHIPQEEKALQEIRRILVPGGQAIVQVPIALALDTTFEDTNVISPDDRLKKYGQHDHVRLYGRDYKKRLEASGFTVAIYNLFEEYKKFGLNPKEDLYVISKP